MVMLHIKLKGITKWHSIVAHGSYTQDCVKFKDFLGTSKRLSSVLKDWKLKKNTDLHILILLLKC